MKRKPAILLVSAHRAVSEVSSGMLESLSCEWSVMKDIDLAESQLKSRKYDLVIFESNILDKLDFNKWMDFKFKPAKSFTLIVMVDPESSWNELVNFNQVVDDYIKVPIGINDLKNKLFYYFNNVDVNFQPGEKLDPSHGYFSEEKLNEIYEIGGVELLYDLLNQFDMSFPDSIMNVKSAINKGENALAADIMHQLKGTSFTLGLNELGYELGKAEIALKSYMPIELRENLFKIEHLFEKFSTNKFKILQTYES